MRLPSAILLVALCTSVSAQQPSAPGPKVAASANQGMEFSDGPDFKIAGVTDWTAVGGHGSDVTLRTSEDLARATLTLKAQSSIETASAHFNTEEEARLRKVLAATPASYSANRALGEYYLQAERYGQAVPLLETAASLHSATAEDEYDLALGCRGLGDYKQAQQHVRQGLAQKDTADLHRLAGDLDEKLGDPLGAVQQDEAAVRLDPCEENYFVWGSELLLHRAVWQAAEVFKQGVLAHSGSARLLTAWASALFAGALYDEAAQRLCEASDLTPKDTETYFFMGKVELAAPAPLPCIEQKLARFVQQQPQNATANYLYAMALLKGGEQHDTQQVERLLSTSVALNPKYAEAYLQLGILAFLRKDYSRASTYYSSAIGADPQLAEAHYRLAVVYDKSGDQKMAAQELRIHDELTKHQAEVVEQQRREVKQFSVILPAQAQHNSN